MPMTMMARRVTSIGTTTSFNVSSSLSEYILVGCTGGCVGPGEALKSGASVTGCGSKKSVPLVNVKAPTVTCREWFSIESNAFVVSLMATGANRLMFQTLILTVTGSEVFLGKSWQIVELSSDSDRPLMLAMQSPTSTV